MPRFMSFVCPELDTTYEAVYRELAGYLELDVDVCAERFPPDDAVSRVRYHRRQLMRRNMQQELAEALGIDPAAVYAAVNDEGARLLLDALRVKALDTGWRLTVTAGEPPAVIDELEDLICR